MGQKVNPIGLRTGINKDWNSKWYASKKDFATYLNKDIKIRKYLSTKLKDAAVSNVVIERNPKKTEINIYTAKPGVIIGHGGEEIETLKKSLSKLVDENISISIMEIKNPDLSAKIVADMLSMASKKYNQTIIMVMHDMQMADHADRVLTIVDGNVKEGKLY